ncbi:MAG: helix-turn-helix domain-containing protein [Bacteroidales bacterium]
MLSLFFLVLSISMFLVFMQEYNRQHNFPYPSFLFLASPFILLHGPTLWFYVRSLTKQHFYFKKIYLFHLMPFLLMVIQHCVQLLFKPNSEKIAISINEEFVHYWTYPVFMIMTILSPLLYFIWGLILIKKYNSQLKNYFSKLKDIDLKWLRILLYASIAFYFLINIAFSLSLVIPFAPFNKMQMLSFTFSTIYILFLGFFGHKQINLFSTNTVLVELEQIQPNPHVTSEKQSDINNLFVETLLKKMSNDKPFLDSDLTLSSLSYKLNISPDYLSNILNNKLNYNFYDFINHYRVEEFKKESKLPQNKNYTIIAIAYNCGFNSKATFYRVFKNITGITPTEYMQQSQTN